MHDLGGPWLWGEYTYVYRYLEGRTWVGGIGLLVMLDWYGFGKGVVLLVWLCLRLGLIPIPLTVYSLGGV